MYLLAYLFSAGRPSPAEAPTPAGRGHFGCLELLGLFYPISFLFISCPPIWAELVILKILQIVGHHSSAGGHHFFRVGPSPSAASLAGYSVLSAAEFAEAGLPTLKFNSAKFARVFSHRSSPFYLYIPVRPGEQTTLLFGTSSAFLLYRNSEIWYNIAYYSMEDNDYV